MEFVFTLDLTPKFSGIPFTIHRLPPLIFTHRNLKNNGLKFSSMEHKINRLMIAMFAYNAILFVVSSVLGSQWLVSAWLDSDWI